MNKLDSTGYDTDKGTNGYLGIYDERFRHLVDSEINLLELGIQRGGSLLMWRDYFRRAVIAGLDCDAVTVDDTTGRVHVYRGFQQDTAILDKIRVETAADGFDIIIDDASHLAGPSRASFWHLFENHLKPGGVYVIEDWAVGYWDNWPDGKKYYLNLPRDYRVDKKSLADRGLDFIYYVSVYRMGTNFVSGILKKVSGDAIEKRRKRKFRSHEYGMVGLVKQLIDELGMANITTPGWGTVDGWRTSKFKSMEIFPNLVFIRKDDAAFFKAIQ